MANLSEILSRRIPTSVVNSGTLAETNLKEGQQWVYVPYLTYSNQPCWISPGNGTVIIEAWGAGGSSATMCCCGMGVPGNAGAFVKKTVEVIAGDWICVVQTSSCGNVGNTEFLGCSGSSCVRICRPCCRNFECICLCAQGGAGGFTICNPQSTGHFCCMAACGICGTVCANQCGIICNLRPGCNDSAGFAYGGDINCTGCIGCVTFNNCAPSSRFHNIHIPYPAGLFSTDGGYISFEAGCCHTDSASLSLIPFGHAVSGMTAKNLGMHIGGYIECYSGNRMCGCQSSTACQRFMPIGVGSMPQFVSGGQQGYGWMGGQPAVRINYIGS